MDLDFEELGFCALALNFLFFCQIHHLLHFSLLTIHIGALGLEHIPMCVFVCVRLCACALLVVSISICVRVRVC